jgi:hypothetical protein
MPRVSSADLAAELNALVAAGTEALARLEQGDESGVQELVERRERLLEILAGDSLIVDASLVDAMRRALQDDIRIIAALERLRARVAADIERASRARQSLGSYRPGNPASAVYIERLG